MDGLQEEEGGGREFICTTQWQGPAAPEKEGMESAGEAAGAGTWFQGELKRNPCVPRSAE